MADPWKKSLGHKWMICLHFLWLIQFQTHCFLALRLEWGWEADRTPTVLFLDKITVLAAWI